MPATRLLVIADTKMLPALANGLRDGGKFDVLTVPFADAAAAQAAAERADAVAVFYGAPDKTLPTALQSLAPKVRERGGRVVAVLQRDQAAQRDECFRAGASDLLFMPMPKDQFLSRLVASVGLNWAPEAGTPAPVSVATRTATSKIDYAAVSPGGVEAPGELPVKSGDTVRLAWGSFQTWGLVVRGGPSAQIRFAGLAPDEEATIRDWLKNGGQVAAATAAAAAPATPPATAPATATVSPTPTPTATAIASPTPTATATATATPGPPAAPASGPPPGFADRKPIRPQTMAPSQTRPPGRVTPPMMTPGNGAVPAVPAAAKDAPAPPTAAPPAGPKPLAGLFEEGAAAGAPAAEGAAASGPTWPTPAPAGAARAAAMQFLRDKTIPEGTAPGLAASTRKIGGMLSSGERAALEKAGPESHLADALAARIALDAAVGEGVVLYGSKGMPNVDAAGITAIAQMADAAAARLQSEANTAIGKGQVEQLQMVTAASAALSRDVLSFKETADRLRGVGAAPRLGAGGLDPEMVLPGQQPRPKTIAPGSAPPQVKAELRDFRGLEGGRGGGKKVLLVLSGVALAASLTWGIFFALPRPTTLPTEAAGQNVLRIDVSGPSSLVIVNQAWAETPQKDLPKLIEVLRSRGVTNAIVRLPSGASVGILDVKNFKFVPVNKPPPPPK